MKKFELDGTTWIIIENALVATDVIAYDELNPEKLVGFYLTEKGDYIQVKSKKDIK